MPSVSGSPTVFVEPQGSQRLPARIDLDLRIEKIFNFSGHNRLQLSLDCLNIINRGVEMLVGSVINDATFAKALYVSDPRTFRAGIRFFF